MNDWRSTFAGINDHEADWELVTVYLADDGEAPDRDGWRSSSHDHSGDELRRAWDDPGLLREGDHPVIFAGQARTPGRSRRATWSSRSTCRSCAGSSRDRPGWCAGWCRWRGGRRSRARSASRSWTTCGATVRRWARAGTARGTPTSITDATAWVRDYRGLWGLDTHDRCGGERAPAGPRYERGGRVRASWADPLGWAGLRKEPPSDAVAEEDLREQIKSLDSRVRARTSPSPPSTPRCGARRSNCARSPPDPAGCTRRWRRSAPRSGSPNVTAELSAERTRVADEREIHRAHSRPRGLPRRRPADGGGARTPVGQAAPAPGLGGRSARRCSC